MTARFSTSDELKWHWLDGADPYRVSETKAEAEQRRASARSRWDRADDVELIGEALVVARVHQPARDRHLWGVFHAGTALPVVMLEPDQDGGQARTLAEALEQWRDPETGEPFDWASDGLSDRVRSPYGRALVDQVRGRDVEDRWAGTAPEDAEVFEVPEQEGLEYRYAVARGVVSVFAPDGQMIARGADRFDPNTRKEACIGEMRDGRRIAGRWSSHFVENAAMQHFIAQQQPAERDELWIHYSGDRAMVHGTDRDDKELKSLLRSCGFTWSKYARAYVTASTTRSVARAQGVDRLARALYEQGRMVEIRADEDRLRGILAPAIPAPAGVTPRPAAPDEKQPAVSPAGLTDEQLAAELERLKGEQGRFSWGSSRYRRLEKQIEPLREEHERRVIGQLQGRADPGEMDDAQIAAEREQLTAETGGTGGHQRGWSTSSPVMDARHDRAELLRVEQAHRRAAELQARPPVLAMSDEDLHAEGAELAKVRFRARDEATDAFSGRVKVVGGEIAARRLRAWGEQIPVGQLDDVELVEEIEQLRKVRLTEAEFAGSYDAQERVKKAHTARLTELRGEHQQRDEKAFQALLEADGRVRYESSSYDSRTRFRIRIDGRGYGELNEHYPGWRATRHQDRDRPHQATGRTEALRWLIEQYEQDPQTRDTRTWGPFVEIELPPAFVTRAVEAFTSLSGQAERYLIERLDTARRTKSAHGSMVYALPLPERTLPVLEQLGRRLVDQLDQELDSDDRKTVERAKRARPNVLRGLDEIRETMRARSLQPLAVPERPGAAAPPDGEVGSEPERVREDSAPALGDLPAPGAGRDAGPGGLLPGPGGGGAGADRRADPGTDGRGDAHAGPSAASGQAAGGPADGPGTGAEGAGVPGAGGGQEGRGAAPPAPLVFRPGSQEDLAPAGERAKAAANLEAVRVLKRIQQDQADRDDRDGGPRLATGEEQRVLARWSGWGAVPEVFAERPGEDDPVFGPGGEREGGYAAAAARWESFADVRDPLRALLDDAEWRAAAASTLSAHYTPPEITAEMWRALVDLGFDGGEVLEPGSGAGVTFGTAPAGARLAGVEIDPTSAAISRLLAPGVTVLNESFADTLAKDGDFDAVVGNVPFARVTLYDPRHNTGRHRMHNHFLVKSVALTRPGGVVALITSRHTLDAESAAARAELFEHADLLGAVRLPNKAFARSAGTDVVTDVLVLRRRAEDEEAADDAWLNAPRRDLGGHQVPVNAYFAAHPEHVLGELTTRIGQRGPELAVEGDHDDVAEDLRRALRQITDAAALADRAYQPHPNGPYRPPLRLRPAAEVQDFTGRLSADAEGRLWQANSAGDPVAVDLPAEEHAQLSALIALKDLVRGLNGLDRAGTDRALADAQRRETKEAYQQYVAAYGSLSRPRQQQNTTTETASGQQERRLTAWGYFLNDPQAYEVLALEWWESDTETVHVSEILERAPATRRSVLGQHTDDPQQALDAVVAERGHVDLDHIAWMLQVDPGEARRRLGRSVFNDPLTGELHHSADYLSGEVRTKLEIARQAAKQNPAFEANVAELERVQPRERLPGQFAIRLGASWIPEDMVQSFFRQHLGDAHLQIQHSGGGNWHVRMGRGLSDQDEVRHSAGGLSPYALVTRLLNGAAMVGRPSDDEEAARAVRVKADEFRDAFEAWVWGDPGRAERAAETYNRTMNNRVIRDFTGSRCSLAGLNPDFTPYDHQMAAAARMAHERGMVLAHEVGAGKTAAMVIGMMAMKNTGLIDKPIALVPNRLVEQWERDARHLYPTARILTLTSEDLADGKRDRVLEYVRANSFDLLIFSHSLFDSIPLSPEWHTVYNDDELRKLRDQIAHEQRRDGKSVSLKQLQERAQRYEQELKGHAAAARTPGQVYLDDLGLDFFAVDEAHEYKNLPIRSKIPGARVSGSGKALHLHSALEWLGYTKPTGPTNVLATGTPLANAIGEMHTMVRLANPELLRDIDAEIYDAWATMFGRMIERMEMTVDGKGFKTVERFASFHNLTALLGQLWHPLVDFKSAEDLGLARPRIKGGQPELMLVPVTADQEVRMQELGVRYEAVHAGGVDKQIDNPLAINTDARIIALDPRLMDADAEPGNKLTALADRIAAKHRETENNRYTYSAADRREHPVPGALQFVFCNHGVPGGTNRGNFNTYQELKDLLVERGVPAEKIAFWQDAQRADQRLKLLQQANHGGINVLIGSAESMGKGLNAQNRAIALYHVDPGYRPIDMEQPNGRILRQGNQNPEVEIVNVGTEGTFDSRMYGTLATKANAFNQLYRARLDTDEDEILEMDDVLLPYEEAMAILSGNPYLIAQENQRKALRTLEVDQRNRATQRSIAWKKLHEVGGDIEQLWWDIRRRAAVLPTLEAVLGEDFRITLGGTEYTRHKDAAQPLVQALARVGHSLPEGRASTPDGILGHLGGLELVAVAFRDDAGEPQVRLHLEGLPRSLQRWPVAELQKLKGQAVLRSLVDTITGAPDQQVEDQENLAAKRVTRDSLLIYAEQLRGQVSGLPRAREHLRMIDALVAAQAEVNKLGKPKDDDPVAISDARRSAVARRDELQERRDRFEADPSAAQVTPEPGEILFDRYDGDPDPPERLNVLQREGESAALRAYITVHGDPDGTVTARLTALDIAAQTTPGTDTAPPLDLATAPAPAAPAATVAPAAAAAAGDAQPTERPNQAPGPPGDGFGTADLFDAFGLTPPEHVPAAPPQDDPEPTQEDPEPAEPGEGQMTVEEVEAPAAVPAPATPAREETAQPEEPGLPVAESVTETRGEAKEEQDPQREADPTREHLISDDGRLRYALFKLPDDGVDPKLVVGWERRRDEFAAQVQAHNEQATHTPEQRAKELARWRRRFRSDNGLQPFKPLPRPRLPKRPDGPGYVPEDFGIGSWVTWTDMGTGQSVTGQVMGQMDANTWFVTTDRTPVTGEYFYLNRSKDRGEYEYVVGTFNTGGDPARLADGPGEQVPFADLPAVDGVTPRPVPAYADHQPGRALAPVREPIQVTVGETEFYAAEVAFPVTVDGIPFLVAIERHERTGVERFEPRIETADDEVLARLYPQDSRGAAIAACERMARDVRELADKDLYANHRGNDLTPVEGGVCRRCSLHAGDNEVKQLYRVNGGDPLCVPDISLTLSVDEDEVTRLGWARRIMAARIAPEPPPATEPAQPQEETSVEQETAAAPAPQEPHEVQRDAISPGDVISVDVSVSFRTIERPVPWGDQTPERVTVTGTVYPGWQDYHTSVHLLDAVIHDPDGHELAAGEDILLREFRRGRLVEAGHRDDLRPEPRTAGQIRRGDLIAEGGTRGEAVTELRYATGRVTTFFTRDVAKGKTNSFTLSNADEVLVVPRERRQPQDVAAVFGRHNSHAHVVNETRHTHDLYAKLEEAAATQWPGGDGPQEELRALREAISRIAADPSGSDAYQANAEAMTAADAAAAAVFDQSDDTARHSGYIGEPLHQLRQYLDVQAHRLRADVAHIAHLAQRGQERAAADDQPARAEEERRGVTQGAAASESSGQEPSPTAEDAAVPAQAATPTGPAVELTQPSHQEAPQGGETMTPQPSDSPARETSVAEVTEEAAPSGRSVEEPAEHFPASTSTTAAEAPDDVDHQGAAAEPSPQPVPRAGAPQPAASGPATERGEQVELFSVDPSNPSTQAVDSAQPLAPAAPLPLSEPGPAAAGSHEQPALVSETADQSDESPTSAEDVPTSVADHVAEADAAVEEPTVGPEVATMATEPVPAAEAPQEGVQDDETGVAEPQAPATPTAPAPARTDPTEGSAPDTPQTTEDTTMATPASPAAEGGGQQQPHPQSAGDSPLSTAPEPDDVIRVGASEYARFTQEDGTARVAGRRDGRVGEVLPWSPQPLAHLAWEILASQQPAGVEQHRLVEAAVRDLSQVYRRLAMQARAMESHERTVGEEASLTGIRQQLADPAPLVTARLPEVESELRRLDVDSSRGDPRPDHSAGIRRLTRVRDGLLAIQAATTGAEADSAPTVTPAPEPAVGTAAPGESAVEEAAGRETTSEQASTASEPSSAGSAAEPEPEADEASEGAERQREDQAADISASRPAPEADEPELPLWTGPEGAALTTTAIGPTEPFDVFEEFRAVEAAWAERMPAEAGTAQDLRRDLEQQLRELQAAFHRAIPGPAPAGPRPPGEASSHDAQAAAAAVNEALREADAYAGSLRPTAEWRQVQALRAAVRGLWDGLKEKAGPWVQQLMADSRAQGFWRTVSIRTCDWIARRAQAGADWLRRGAPATGDPQALPAAEALMKLSDAAIAYSNPAPSGPPPAPAGSGLDELKQLREELATAATQGNGRPPSGLAAAAANARSTSSARPSSDRSGSPGEQHEHLRRTSSDPRHGHGPGR